MQTPAVGSKVRFIRPDWYDPSGTVLADETGTVESVEIEKDQTQPTILIKLSKFHPNLDGGLFAYYPHCGPHEPNGDEVDTLAQFWHHCEIVN